MEKISNSGRIHIIDALRGFALAGIVIVHVVEQYLGGPPPEGKLDYAITGIPNQIVNAIILLFLRGKFFALFSLLFGLSFFIQMENASNRRMNYSVRFIWRAILLFIIGYLHHLFYRGDILTIYAILAIPLVPFYRWSNKWIWVINGLILLGVIRLLLFIWISDENIFGGIGLNPTPEESNAFWDTLASGTLLEVMASNAVEGMQSKMNFQWGIIYRGYLTFAFFLLGLWIGRIGYLHHFKKYIKISKKVMWWSLGGMILFMVLAGICFAQLGSEVSFDQLLAVIGLHLFDLSNLFMTIVIVCLFVLAFNTRRGHKWLSSFQPYGRMALTNYFLQSVIGTFILYGWGLGYLGQWQNWQLFMSAIVLISVQMVFSKKWLHYYRYGPLEWLWRCGTKLKWQKNRLN